jgi:hypothetical protein
MEVLQCDGCDFRAPSYEDLKAHIQDVHTAFLQPTDVAEDNDIEPRSGSMNASNQTEVEFSSIKDEFAIAEDLSCKSILNSAYLIYFHCTLFFFLASSHGSWDMCVVPAEFLCKPCFVIWSLFFSFEYPRIVSFQLS